MRLRNKKTGTIVDVLVNPTFTEYNRDGSIKNINTFNSLAELTKEWEDYEEKTAWFIDPQGDIQEWRDADCDDWTNEKQIGNYFKTKEEAEKAVEKLKAWKRLKDKGFRHTHFVIDHKTKSAKVVYKAQELSITFKEAKQFYEDFYLLFGGEE